MRSKCRWRSRTLMRAAVSVGVATVTLVGGGPGTGAVAHAEPPPNLTAIPSDVPGEIDAVIPPPPIKKLNRIPQRSKIEGGSEELQELREAVMPSPVGDRFFDHWPADLAALEPGGDLIATRNVTQVAGFLVTVPLRSARQIKFRTTDATGGPLFGTATLFVPREGVEGPGGAAADRRQQHAHRRAGNHLYTGLHVLPRVQQGHQQHRPVPAPPDPAGARSGVMR